MYAAAGIKIPAQGDERHIWESPVQGKNVGQILASM
jgi:hypothetical protein